MKTLENLRKSSNSSSHFIAVLCIGIAWLVFAIFEGIFGEFKEAVGHGFAGLIWIIFAMYFKHLEICSLLLKEIDKLKNEKEK